MAVVQSPGQPIARNPFSDPETPLVTAGLKGQNCDPPGWIKTFFMVLGRFNSVRNNSPLLVAGGWWVVVVVAGGWWLVAGGGGWWLVAGGWWLVAWWLVGGGWWHGGWWLGLG